MTKKENACMIKMKSTQIIDGESNELELITEGKYENRDNTYCIEYVDSEATGFEGSTTTIEVTGKSLATINRSGSTNSNLVIELGKKHHCHYETPYGDMMVGIYTHKILNQLNSDGGHLYLKYTIDINSSYVSDNEIDLNIEKI